MQMEIVAIDFFIVPTVRNRILFVFLLLAHFTPYHSACKSVPRQPDLTRFRATPARFPRLQPTEVVTPGIAQSSESAPFG